MFPKGKHALTLARMGFKVFPLRVDDPNLPPSEIKKPAIKEWQKHATTDPAQIVKRWEEADYNIAIATTKDDRLVILDYDCKPGQKGAVALGNHRAFDIPETMAVKTPTGGLHLYFLAPTGVDIPNSVSKVAEHVDVRGQSGGYVVAPGSTIHGKPYTLRAGCKHDALPELPSWLVRKAQADRKKTDAKKGEVLGTLDTEDAIRRAERWLADDAPEAVEGHGGNNTTYQVACKVKDFGVSKEQCLELMAKWNETKAAPPWDFDELERITDNAYQYATLPVGVANATAEFAAAGALVVDMPAPKPRRLFSVNAKQCSLDAVAMAGEPLIDDLIDRGTLSVLYGKPKGGKTFVAMDLAYRIASGTPWFGNRKVQQGLVVYVAAEGGRGVYKRLAALDKAHDFPATLPFEIVPCPINLMAGGKNSDTKQLVDLVREVEKRHGQRCELLVIDTLSRALAGGDENSSVDMGNFVRHIDAIRATISAHVMIVHHAGKDASKGARGWSGIQAALDTEIEVADNKVSVRNQRDMDELEPVAFRRKVVKVGPRKSDGKEITSCVVEYYKETEFPIDMSSAEQRYANALRDFARKNTTDNVLEPTDIDAALKSAGLSLGRSTRYDVLSALSGKSVYKKVKRGQYLILDNPESPERPNEPDRKSGKSALPIRGADGLSDEADDTLAEGESNAESEGAEDPPR